MVVEYKVHVQHVFMIIPSIIKNVEIVIWWVRPRGDEPTKPAQKGSFRLSL
jgi:hypothetical protein